MVLCRLSDILGGFWKTKMGKGVSHGLELRQWQIRKEISGKQKLFVWLVRRRRNGMQSEVKKFRCHENRNRKSVEIAKG